MSSRDQPYKDLIYFREIWDQVVNIWFDYLNSQKDFQSNIEYLINSIYNIVRKGPLDKLCWKTTLTTVT
jgi:hypothetical protein